MSDYSLDDAYSMAQTLEDKVNEAWDKAVGFHKAVKDGDMEEGTVDYLSKEVESGIESAHDVYTDLKHNLSDIEQIRDQVTKPGNIVDEVEDRYLEEELDQGEMSEVVEYFDISIDPVDKPPENPEETVRYIIQNLRSYDALHSTLENWPYDFDLPDMEFEEDTGDIIEETAEETIDRWTPNGRFFSEE